MPVGTPVPVGVATNFYYHTCIQPLFARLRVYRYISFELPISDASEFSDTAVSITTYTSEAILEELDLTEADIAEAVEKVVRNDEELHGDDPYYAVKIFDELQPPIAEETQRLDEQYVHDEIRRALEDRLVSLRADRVVEEQETGA